MCFIFILRPKITQFVSPFQPIGVDGGLHKIARDGTSTDHIQYHGPMFPRRLNQEFLASAHLCVLHIQKSILFFMAYKNRLCH